MSLCGIRREITVPGDDTFHSIPVGRDVCINSPRRTYIMYPSAREIPAAYIDTNIFSAGMVDGLTNGCIALFLVKVEMLCVLRRITAAEINLDEVKLQVFEKVIGILLIVSIETYTASQFVFIPEITTGIASCIGIDTSLEAQAMDMLDNGFQTIRESGGMNQ